MNTLSQRNRCAVCLRLIRSKKGLDKCYEHRNVKIEYEHKPYGSGNKRMDFISGKDN